MVRNIYSLLLLFFLLPAPLCLKNQKPIYISDEMSWRDAQIYCRHNHTDLLTIRNMGEDQVLANRDKAWIGLYRESSTSEWKWSRGGRKASFTNLEDDEPHVAWNCVTKEASNKGWRSAGCWEHHAFLCYDDTLVLIQELKTWEEALQHCRALQAMNATLPPTAYLNHRYDLATLKKSDLSKAKKIAQEAATNEVWTGLHFLAGQWLWVGGEPVRRMSLPLCPAQQHYCGVLAKNINTTLVEKDCTERRNFLCYRKPAKRRDLK